MSSHEKKSAHRGDKGSCTGGRPRIPIASPAAWIVLVALAVFPLRGLQDELAEERGPTFPGVKGVGSRTYSELTALEGDCEVHAGSVPHATAAGPSAGAGEP